MKKIGYLGANPSVAHHIKGNNMSPDAILISKPEIHWEKFLNASSSLLERSLTSDMDAKKIPVGDCASFIGALATLKNPNADLHVTLRDGDKILRHVSLSFLCFMDAPVFFEFMEHTRLAFINTPSKRIEGVFAIVSGNLETWKDAVLSCSKLDKSHDLRFLMNKILLILDRQNLGELFGSYSKTSLNDKTFILELKK